MPALHELQREFAAMLRGARVADPRRELYRRTVRGTQGKALAAVYPVLARLLGEACFDGLCRHYLHDVPSRCGDLHEFGGEMAAVLGSTALGAEYPWLPDVARLEWAMHRVFHARDARPTSLARLAEIAPESHAGLRFRLAPASALLASDYPVHLIWEANQPERDGELDITPAIITRPTRLLLLRQPAAIAMFPLGRGEFALLAALRDGQALGAAIEAALREEQGFDAGRALAEAFGRGAIDDFSIDNDHPGGTLQ